MKICHFGLEKDQKGLTVAFYRYKRHKNVKTEEFIRLRWSRRDREVLKIQTVFFQFNDPGVFFQLSFVIPVGFVPNHRLFSYGVSLGKAF